MRFIPVVALSAFFIVFDSCCRRHQERMAFRPDRIKPDEYKAEIATLSSKKAFLNHNIASTGLDINQIAETAENAQSAKGRVPLIF